MSESIYNFPTRTSGLVWPGIAEFRIKINGANPPVSLESVKIQFRKGPLGSIKLELNSENGTVIIKNSISWIFSIPPIKISLWPRVYSYTIVTTDSNGKSSTYIKGEWLIV